MQGIFYIIAVLPENDNENMPPALLAVLQLRLIFPAVLGGRYAQSPFKRLGKCERIRIAAGACNLPHRQFVLTQLLAAHSMRKRIRYCWGDILMVFWNTVVR